MTTISDSITSASRQFDCAIKHSADVFTQLGVTYMAMQRVTKDGFWSIITSNPEWMEYSSSHEFYSLDPTLVNPDHYESGISFLPSHQHEEFQNTFRWHAETYFDLGNCLGIIEKVDGDAWCTFLSAPVKNTNIISTYISKFNYIKQAIQHFRLNNKKIFHHAFDHSVDLKIINEAAYTSANNIVQVEPFYETENSRQLELFKQLSPREREIMQHFLQGKTAKQTAKLINLSFRTIENYFDNIKTKFGCHHKRDLIVLFNQS